MATHKKIAETKNGVFYSECKKKTKRTTVLGTYYKNAWIIKINGTDVSFECKLDGETFSSSLLFVRVKDCGKYWEVY